MNEVVTRELTPLQHFKRDMKSLHDAGELALPSTVSFDAFRNASVVAVTDNPRILQCTRESVFKAIRTLAGAGLVPDGREAAIVPFGKEAQAMPMVFGLIKVARNSGKISSLWAEVVYEGERLEVGMEDGNRIWKHVTDDGDPIDAMSRGGEIRGAYAVAKMTDKTVEFQPMSHAEIEKRRKVSRTQKDPGATGIWGQWYEEMAKKTVIRNLVKRLPMSTEDVERIMLEQEQPQMQDITPDHEDKLNLAQRLAAAKDEPEPVEGEVMSETHSTEAGSSLETEKYSPAYEDGLIAAEDTKEASDNPHPEGSQEHTDWHEGYLFGTTGAAQ